ncbi:MAG: hypothetical protein KC933_35080, partial [Myxococcales bacterium]|nr:hypothetical protein [Myxococcales bacterium]
MATTKKRKATARKATAEAVDANVARLEKIVAIMEGSSLFALEYEDADIEVRLTRGAPAAVA